MLIEKSLIRNYYALSELNKIMYRGTGMIGPKDRDQNMSCTKII